MLAAEEWRKYEESYLKYGVQLQPEEPEQERRKKKAQKAEEKPKYRVTAGDRILVLVLIIAVGICFAFAVCLQAFQSDINYNINQLNQESKSLTGDIDNLNVELNSNNQLDAIEQTARDNFGMIYPAQNQYVYVVDNKGSSEVNDYVEALAESQRGTAIQKDVTPAEAAGHLLA